MVRTSDFHSGNRGSIPRRTAKAADSAAFSFFITIAIRCLQRAMLNGFMVFNNMYLKK